MMMWTRIDVDAESAYHLRYIDSRLALRAARAALRRAERTGYLEGIARSLVAAGAAQAWVADLDGAASDLERAVEIFERHPDPIGQARAHAWQGMLARHSADYAASLRLFSRALALHYAEGDRSGVADVKRMIGKVQALAGDFVPALESISEARTVAEALGDQHALALCHNDAGVALFELGDLEIARSHFESALASFRHIGAVSSEVHSLNNLGCCWSALGDHERGRATLVECLMVCERSGERLPVTRATLNVGRIDFAIGELQRALGHFEDAEKLSRAIGERRTEIDAMIWTARGLLRLGETDAAVAKLDTARQAAESSGIQRIVAGCHEALAEAHEVGGRPERAIHHLRLHHGICEQIRRAGTRLRMQYYEEIARMERAHQEAEMRVLKAQLQPHFLLNALHLVSALIRINPREATRAVVRLGDLLRLAIEQSSTETTTLGQEIGFVSAYLELQQLRYRGAFTHRIETVAGTECIEVPHLLLQPLVENAIVHGLPTAPHEVAVEIRVERISTKRVRILVLDTGVGLDHRAPVRGTGIGLHNTRLRLQRMYGSEHQFRIEPAPGGGTRVTIELPLRHRQPIASVEDEGEGRRDEGGITPPRDPGLMSMRSGVPRKLADENGEAC
jgi:tetratricopeptide (TPR) repeat protein/anti-sigma regulatory factor (Ser/Thr protein kinase)